MSSWYKKEKGWKRKKFSLYLKQHVHKQLVRVAEMNQLSFSETANRLIEKGLRN